MKIPTLFKEYIWLVETIQQAGRITFAEINKRWIKTEMSGGVDFSRTTFNRHRDAILDIFGIIIECDRKDGSKYYIENERVLREDSVQNWMLATLSVSNMVGESQGLQRSILLEHVPSGGDLLRQVVEAMRDCCMVAVSYRRYGSETSSRFVLAPYCVKLFCRRWYLLGRFEDSQNLGTFSLDRMERIEVLKQKFKMDKDFDAADYFSESYGIVVSNIEPERIVLRAYGAESYYLRDLPLHRSQREINTTGEYTDFELMLRPTADFKAALMARGEWIEVLEPQQLAEEIAEWHRRAAERYKK